MMRNLLTAAAILPVAVLLSGAVATPASAQNLLTNGSFESPAYAEPAPAGCTTGSAVTDWMYCISSAVPGWDVEWVSDGTLGNLEFQTTATLGLVPADGSQYAELDTAGRSPDARVKISQTGIGLCILDTYTLTYAYTKREANDVLAVTVDDAPVVPVGPAPAVQSWNSYSVVIGPGLTDVDIAFAEVGPGSTIGSLLDNVSLEDDADRSACNPYINVHPGSDPNPLNLGSGGTTPVAIFGSAELDVSLIDVGTLAFADAGVKTVGKSDKALCSIKDIGSYDEAYFDNLDPTPDGYDDLVCHFVTAEILGLSEGEGLTVNLVGDLIGGGSIYGSDVVKVVKE